MVIEFQEFCGVDMEVIKCEVMRKILCKVVGKIILVFFEILFGKIIYYGRVVGDNDIPYIA